LYVELKPGVSHYNNTTLVLITG